MTQKQLFQSPTKSVIGVEIFGAGTWTDSEGQEHEWTRAQLDTLVQNASAEAGNHRISIKAGHTSTEFNAALAKAMGVPIALLTGEGGTGGGQIALGHVATVRRVDDKLVADFAGVPVPLADLIATGAYQGVSVEIELVNGDPENPVLTAVALLGAEEPAVESLAGLSAATVFGAPRENVLRYGFIAHPVPSILDASDDAGLWEALKGFARSLRGESRERVNLAAMSKAEKVKLARSIEDRFKAISWLSADLGLPDEAPLIDVLAQLSKLLTAAQVPAASALPGAKMAAKAAADLYHTVEERLRSVKWLTMDLGLAEDAPIPEIIAALEGLQAGAGESEQMAAPLPHESMFKNQELSDFLENAVEAKVTEERPREDVIASIASAAGISEGTVNTIVSGTIECPPLDRLRGIAEVLDVSMGSLQAAAEAGGCDYGEGDDDDADMGIHRPKRMEADMTQEATAKKFAEHPLAPEMLAILAELGLGEDATTDMVIAAIQDLKAMMAAKPGARLAASKAGEPTETEKGLIEQLSKLKHKELVQTYAKKAEGWTGIEGTAGELGEELATLHETAGEDAAKRVVESYTKASKVNTEGSAAITRSIGTARAEPGDDADPFEKEMWEYAKENNVTFQVASAHFNKTQPENWTAYYRRKKEAQEPVTA